MNAFTARPTRRAVYAPNGIAATSQPLAAAAGAFVLREGGTAVDAAIAMAAVLTVVEPTSNGIGSDVMAIVGSGQEIEGFIGAGRTPALFDPEVFLAEAGARGWHPVTVPGAPRAWIALSERYGRLPFARLLAPAIEYARKGFALSPVVAEQWRRAAEIARTLDGPEFAGFAPTFLPEGFAPAAGTHFANPDLADTLERVAASKAEDFYCGALAERMARFSKETGGWLRAEDLAAHEGEWVQPCAVNYRGRRVYELPPPTQGAVALIALGILDALDIANTPEESEHRAIEAVKLALQESLPMIADGPEARDWLHSALDKAALAGKAGTIGASAASGPTDARLDAGTVYLAAADRDGMMASFIQSNFMDFGSYIVIPGTGISLANRGWCFSREANHPNAPRPGHRPYNTIIPGFLADEDGDALGPFGVMGGYMQPQGQVQVLTRLLDAGLDPQAALDTPRWRFFGGRKIACETEFDPDLRAALARRGHEISVQKIHPPFGRGQMILRHGNGYVAGSDNRGDGCALGY